MFSDRADSADRYMRDLEADKVADYIRTKLTPSTDDDVFPFNREVRFGNVPAPCLDCHESSWIVTKHSIVMNHQDSPSLTLLHHPCSSLPKTTRRWCTSRSRGVRVARPFGMRSSTWPRQPLAPSCAWRWSVPQQRTAKSSVISTRSMGTICPCPRLCARHFCHYCWRQWGHSITLFIPDQHRDKELLRANTGVLQISVRDAGGRRPEGPCRVHQGPVDSGEGELGVAASLRVRSSAEGLRARPGCGGVQRVQVATQGEAGSLLLAVSRAAMRPPSLHSRAPVCCSSAARPAAPCSACTFADANVLV